MLKEEKDIHPVDIHVGRRVRFARVTAGFTQTAAGRELGLSFQQIQKYESGANRISASRLFEISMLTGHPIEWFFEGLDRKGTSMRNTETDIISPSECAFLLTLRALPEDMRRAMMELARVLPED